MTLEKLKQEVLDEAEKQARAITAETEREKEKILGEARTKAKAVVEENRRHGEARAKEMAVELKASALLQAKRIESEAMEEAVESVLHEVRRGLEEIAKSGHYEKIFDSLAAQAIRALGEKEFVLKANAKDKKLAAKHGRVGEAIGTIGGVIAAKADGSIQINNTFEALLEENEEKLKQKAFEHLFGRQGESAQTHAKRAGGKEKSKASRTAKKTKRK